MFMTVIDGRVCCEVPPRTPGSFHHCGSWWIHYYPDYK